MSISLATVNLFLDHQARAYARLAGGSSYGMGVIGDTDKARGAIIDLQTAMLATADDDVIGGSRVNIASYLASMSALKAGTSNGILNDIERLARAVGLTNVGSLDQYLTYYNRGVGGINNALQSQYFRAMFNQWKGSYPTFSNIYFELLRGGSFNGVTFTRGLGDLLVGTGWNHGTDITTTSYCGGVPYVHVSGFAGSSGLVTVTGTQYNPADGTFTSGKTWTATVTGNGDFALASGGGATASANALIVANSAISAAGTITAPTLITVEAHRPAGRLAVPF